MRAARNIAIIALLALIVAVVPGGDNAGRAILTALSLVFLALIGFAGWQLYRQYRFTYLQLDERRRALLLGALGAIVLMIAGADELTETGGGLVVWLAVLGAAIFAIFGSGPTRAPATEPVADEPRGPHPRARCIASDTSRAPSVTRSPPASCHATRAAQRTVRRRPSSSR